MQHKKVRGEPRWRKAARVGALTTLMAGAMAATAPGCLDRPLEPIEPRITTTIVERLTQSSVDKIDLLLVIDNSRSMADKQEILGLAVPDLVNELINPWCIDDAVPPNKQPVSDPLADCPDGYKREFDPIRSRFAFAAGANESQNTKVPGAAILGSTGCDKRRHTALAAKIEAPIGQTPAPARVGTLNSRAGDGGSLS